MSVFDKFRDADGERVQPYFAAFMLERGYRRISDGDSLEFLEWIEARWREFETLNGIRPCGIRSVHSKHFAAWLAARAIDHQARQCVEAE